MGGENFAQRAPVAASGAMLLSAKMARAPAPEMRNQGTFQEWLS
jgi:hypothetical protein